MVLACAGAYAQGGFHAFRQALLGVRAYFEAVDYHVDVVFFGLFELGQVFCVEHLAINAKAHIAQRLHVGKQVGELAFFLARHRGQQHQTGVLRQGQHGVHHLADGL